MMRTMARHRDRRGALRQSARVALRTIACSALAAAVIVLPRPAVAQGSQVPTAAAPLEAPALAPSHTAQVDKIWEGAYSEAQAERGKVPFTGVCRRCHGDDLAGTRRGPALHGPSFMADWEAQDLRRLFDKIRDTMPPDNPSSFDDNEYLDVLTYVLKANGYPAGPNELTPASMESVQITRKLQPGEIPPPPRNFSVVEVVGCLKHVDGQNWILTKTTDPILSNGRPSSLSELQGLVGRPLGSETFDLVGIAPYKPEQNDGRKIQAKGLFYKSPEKTRLNLSSFQVVAPSCS
jgi:S-disulfanyl-L-cysteine oxidoreductase SoxD